MPDSFRRLRVIRDVLPLSAGFMSLPAAPPLFAGDVVLASDGPTTGLDPAHVAVVIEVGGPWFGVPKDAIEPTP